MQESAEVGPRVEEVHPTMLANFAQELVECERVSPSWGRENSDLRSQLLSGRSGEERERKQHRSLASSTLDLVPLSRTPTGGWSEHATDDSRCFSQNGDSDRQCRSKSTFKPIQSSVQARYGLRGERVGEASNPGPDREGGGCGPNTRRFRCTRIWSCVFQSDSEGPSRRLAQTQKVVVLRM